METDQYIDVFLDESREHLQSVNDNILQLEKQPKDLTLVAEIFRSAHTLKGMAATMGFEDIVALTHQMENVLDKIRNSELVVTVELIDIIFLAIEALEEMVEAIGDGNDGEKDVTNLVTRLGQLESGAGFLEQPPQSLDKHSLHELELDEFQASIIAEAEELGFHTYQITVTLTDDCILKAARAYMVVEALEGQGELIKTVPPVEKLEEGNFDQDFSLFLLSNESSEKLKVTVNKVSEIKHVEILPVSITKRESNVMENTVKESDTSIEKEKTAQKNHHSSKTIRVSLDRIDDLMNLFEEMVIDRSRLEDLTSQIDNKELEETVEHVTRVSEDMQSLILAMRMVPVEQVFNRFPRMVRGLAKDLDKDISLEIIGAETELDRTVIDEIGDPLVHLIRNSVDHGIEFPSDRKQSGKPEEGKLILRAYHSGNHVFIDIEDDGVGINREKVVEKAITNGLLTVEETKELTDDEAFQLIFSSGFSTADQVSDISGRGVGLDVVKSKIESLGGRISLESKNGEGSKFSIQLPLTLSILSTLLVKVQLETYAIPLSSIMETALLQESQVMYAHGQKVINFRGNIIPLVSLSNVFQVSGDESIKQEFYAVVIVKKGEKLTGLIVDEFIGQKEIVLKSLGNYLGDVFAISGATILGDGQVALIIDPNALIK